MTTAVHWLAETEVQMLETVVKVSYDKSVWGGRRGEEGKKRKERGEKRREGRRGGRGGEGRGGEGRGGTV